ncbi:MAG: fibrobacter succinogenes major paralogous domain-containing protein [Candidatus Marinimicrobia bacterium]|nr:fibrobacter succinogenes major paralogous domain-containing protein [Candidatus Neomarinimicrobiota bacterium]
MIGFKKIVQILSIIAIFHQFLPAQGKKMQIFSTNGTVITLPVAYIDSINFVDIIAPIEQGIVTDIDNNTYATVKIGDQWWMAENLRVTHYRNGDPIPKVTDNTEWDNLTTGAYCYYNNIDSNGVIYGALYNKYAAFNSRNIAPAGWHHATDDDWNKLIDNLGLSGFYGQEGLALKSTTGWLYNGNGIDCFGFNALPTGIRASHIGFNLIGNATIFYSNSLYSIWALNSSHEIIQMHDMPDNNGYSIRCVKD